MSVLASVSPALCKLHMGQALQGAAGRASDGGRWEGREQGHWRREGWERVLPARLQERCGWERSCAPSRQGSPGRSRAPVAGGKPPPLAGVLDRRVGSLEGRRGILSHQHPPPDLPRPGCPGAVPVPTGKLRGSPGPLAVCKGHWARPPWRLSWARGELPGRVSLPEGAQARAQMGLSPSSLTLACPPPPRPPARPLLLGLPPSPGPPPHPTMTWGGRGVLRGLGQASSQSLGSSRAPQKRDPKESGAGG